MNGVAVQIFVLRLRKANFMQLLRIYWHFYYWFYFCSELCLFEGYAEPKIIFVISNGYDSTEHLKTELNIIS